MTVPDDRLSELRVGDMLILIAVKRCGSVHGASRELRVATSQVSKAVSRLESFFNADLLARGARGVTFTESGDRVLSQIEEIISRLRFVQRNESLPGLEELTIAAPSYLSSFLIPIIARASPSMRIRALELPPPSIRALITDNCFEMAILLGEDDLGDPWVTEPLGRMRQALFGSPSIVRTLGPSPVSVDRIRDIPFVTPIAAVHGRVVHGDDGCPLDRLNRKTGHEVQTVGLGFEVAAETDQLVFGPEPAARQLVARNALAEIKVEGWNETSQVSLLCNVDRVTEKMRARISAAVKKALEDPR
jgi:DNA-binding transcriptional LysR family regulator